MHEWDEEQKVVSTIKNRERDAKEAEEAMRIKREQRKAELKKQIDQKRKKT